MGLLTRYRHARAWMNSSSRTAMDRLLARSAAIALCALWAGAANAANAPATNESAAPNADALTGPAATQLQPSDQPGANDPDIAAVIKNLPANLDGEIRRAQ